MRALLRLIGLPLVIRLAVNRDDLRVMGEAVDQRDGARGIGKDRVHAEDPSTRLWLNDGAFAKSFG